MAGQGILIIIIPNDLNNEQIVKEPSELPIKTNNTTTDIEYSKGYPCSVCGASLASRFRYHISPKLNLIDAIWILSENHQHFFMTCFTELGQHSDVILEELRLAEIGIRQGSKVLILPLACALGIENLLSASPTIVEINGLNNTINEITNSNESESLINNDNELNQRLGTNKSDFKRIVAMVILRIKEVVPIIRDDQIAQFWHDDVRIVRDQNKTIRRTNVNNLVNMWKAMTSGGPSSLSVELRLKFLNKVSNLFCSLGLYL